MHSFTFSVMTILSLSFFQEFPARGLTTFFNNDNFRFVNEVNDT